MTKSRTCDALIIGGR